MSYEPEQTPDFTRRKQTFFLSAEFLVTMVIQTGVFLIIGTTTVNRLDARITALETQQVTAERIARIEEKMLTLLENQTEFKAALREVQDDIRTQARAAKAVDHR